MNNKILGLAFFVLCSSRVLLGMSWEKCVEAANSKNPELRAAKDSLRAAELAERAAYNGFFPSVSAALSYDHGTAIGGTGAASTYTASLNAKQNLFSGLADAGAVKKAGGNALEIQAKMKAVRSRVSYDLKAAFAGVSFANKSQALSAEIVQRREANRKLVDLRFQSGRENKGSALLAGAYLEQARLDLLQATNTRETQKALMGRVLGDELAQVPELTGDLPITEPPDLAAIEKLVTETPDYLKVVALEQQAEATMVIARSGFFPTLNLTGSTGNSDNQFFPGNNRWSVGASLVFPLFNGGRDYYGTRAAAADSRAATLARENAIRVGRATLRDVLAKFREAVQKQKVDQAFAEATTARSKIAREKYNNGLLTFEDWDVIENDLIVRQRNYLQSQRDRIIAEAAWEQATGRGVFQ